MDSILPRRRIAHLDMDAFYASVELLRYPQLKGLPVVIGGSRRAADDALALKADACGGPHRLALQDFPRLRDYAGRGVITTATYAARQHGVGSAMGLMKAARLCPDAILLPVDFTSYRHCSRLFKAEVLKLTEHMEDRGIDEVYIDFSDLPGVADDDGLAIAARLQADILAATGLTCSIGIAPNKLLAKMASEFNKPHGIALVREDDVQRLIWPLPCRRINGIGPRTEERLRALGIGTIGELAACAPDWLAGHFGNSSGRWLHEAAHGRDTRPLQRGGEPVSISRETTFGRDLHARHDRAELGAIFTRLCEQLAADLQRKGYAGRTVGIKIRYDDFRSATRDLTLPVACSDAAALRASAGQCLKRVPLDRRLRLLGVRVSSLRRAGTPGEGADRVQEPVPAGYTLPLFG